MTDGRDGGSALIHRIRNILLAPTEEWPRIAAEPATARQILLRYVVPLALLAPLASFVGSQLYGLSSSYRPSFVNPLGVALARYVLGVAGVVLLALVADFLAPKFGGEANRANAFKLVAYSWTAFAIAGAFALFPPLSFLILLGLYCFYLLYTGATPLMKVPPDRLAGYVLVTALSAVGVTIAAMGVASALVGHFVPGPTYMSETGTVSGAGRIDADKAREAADAIEAASRKPAVDPARLQALLPSAVGGYARTEMNSTATEGGGSKAEGTYTAGERTFRLTILDTPALSPEGNGAAAISASSSAEARTPEGYEKRVVVDGRRQVERWSVAGTGLFSLVVAGRFTIAAEGSAARIDELKAAVATVNEATLVGLVN